MKRLSLFLICIVIMLSLAFSAQAGPETTEPQAEQLQLTVSLLENGNFSCAYLVDGAVEDSPALGAGSILQISCEEEMSALYLQFWQLSDGYMVTDEETGISVTWGSNGFLYDFLDLENLFGHCPRELTVTFANGEAELAEITAYSAGEIPSSVQRWSAMPEGGADLLLFSTHGDDEQLYFAGLLPYYAGELGYRVQVIYFTDHHNNNPARIHEMLTGLWTVGVRYYPVFGPFPDFRIDDKEACYAELAQRGYTADDVCAYITLQLRKYHPLVAVGHAVDGEYGHGQHKIYSEQLRAAVESAGSPDCYPESATLYGTWEVPKAYLHLYPENRITMDWDIPLESFGGMTAFEVTQKLGFPCHKSQQATSFPDWINSVSRASELHPYSPCEYGLYRSTVGFDTGLGDMFEHLTPRGAEENTEITGSDDGTAVENPVEAVEPESSVLSSRPKVEAEPPVSAEAPEEAAPEPAEPELESAAAVSAENIISRVGRIKSILGAVGLLAAGLVLLIGDVIWILLRRKHR